MSVKIKFYPKEKAPGKYNEQGWYCEINKKTVIKISFKTFHALSITIPAIGKMLRNEVINEELNYLCSIILNVNKPPKYVPLEDNKHYLIYSHCNKEGEG
jgi:hypothetical protein